jgi:hypothetical protein
VLSPVADAGVCDLFQTMKRVIPIFLLCLLSQVYAAENLMRQDFEGSWKSNYSAVEGETQVLNISLSSRSVFERHFEESFSLFQQSSSENKSQLLETSTFELNDDVLILVFASSDKVFSYKLVLSGWKSDSNKVLYGSMFMYRNGTQFNMLPVSFRPRE